ncbi:POU domain, class 6, transcription factor 2 isoform X1 [Notolabrus celidotus]|nr:POU domain, class 6, transcription factor 2 isoform X1 [Notolabrus celidotus]XP_034562909.1 POU domain, class 6, transcription factor 2 isoform X1 [Notolabrus celidotus]XP_034562910.1 POU domain, class 6, transcription factor 2 isoform X1 [Notolabrus celidotus]XP_034562911.1 POU domain, class 6, transcription factor 2 isoform X1 [Notolabrus celidotus]XP_034562913.1 POU domain, class 6, transcription factor 2 isoform X1 [Notolabrus celidotus]XP_034562914.1 POU domain, class 6, transcription 
MITGQLSKPLLSLRSDMSAAELRADDKAASPDSDLNDEPLLLPSEATDRDGTPNKLYGARDGSVQSDASSSPSEQSHLGQTHPAYHMGPQSLLVAQQLANAVGGVMSGAAQGMNQPILIPFNAGGHLGGQQGLVLSLPTANIQSLVAAAAAGGIMTLPLQNLQATSSLNSQLQHLQQLQQMQQHHQQQQQQHQQQQQQQQQHHHHHQQTHSHTQNQLPPQHHMTPPSQQQTSVPSPGSACSSTSGQPQLSPPHRQNQSPARSLPSPVTPPMPLPLNPLASQAAVAAAAAMGSIAGSQVFGNTLSNLQGASGQLVTNAQGQIIGTIPLMPNSAGPSSQSGGGNPALQVQPITPQLLTNAQGQIIATVIGNQILPVINTQGITLSPIKPGQQQQVQSGPVSSQPNMLHMPHRQSPLHQASSSSSTSSSSSALSVGQLVSNPQTAPSEVDGVNLEEIREFAKAFKIRRLSLGLTQTQVGQALSAAEGPAYSQSAICRHTILRSHFFLPQEAQENTIGSSLTGKLNPGLLYPARFEKLDITPKSAQKIKPVLERWMAEAEARHRSGMQNLTEFIGSEPSKKRKRRTSFTPQALEILNSHFEKNTHPSGQEMTEIAEKLNYDREVVRVWFCNKRQALKNTIKRLKSPELGPTVSMDPLTDSLEELPK